MACQNSITQAELEKIEAIQRELLTALLTLAEQLAGGATVEQGPWVVDRDSLLLALARKPAIDATARISPRR